MQRRLVTDEDAVPTPTQHRKPCADCPFARTALHGWLGRDTVADWIIAIHGENVIHCHCTTNQQCAGAAIFRANVFKVPKHPLVLQLESDTKICFADDREFIAHHDIEKKFQNLLASPLASGQAGPHVKKVTRRTESKVVSRRAQGRKSAVTRRKG